MQLEAIDKDHYRSIAAVSTGEFKDRGSKFIGLAYPCSSPEEFKDILEKVRKEYHDARHHCFAYRLNPTNPEARFNDDGEPSNSAGRPIYNQIEALDLWNVAVIVVRYFGGTKLGVSGLINAYRTGAAEALDQARPKQYYLKVQLEITFDYTVTGEVMRLLESSAAEILEEQMGQRGGYLLQARRSLSSKLAEDLQQINSVEIRYL